MAVSTSDCQLPTASTQDLHILNAFPRPPMGLNPSPPLNFVAGPRPADFGFIHVGESKVQFRTGSIYENDTSFAYEQVRVSNAKPRELQLVLDNPLKLYAPGETITGSIIGWDPSETWTHMHIILEGRAKTYMSVDATEYRDCAPLLYQATHLKSSEQGTTPRFSVTMPEKCTPGLADLQDIAPGGRKCWTPDWPAQDGYESQPDHPLPPSMTLPLRTSHTISSRIAGRGCIEYKLIGVRSTHPTTAPQLTPDATFQLPLQLTTLRLPTSHVQGLMSQTNNTTTNLSIQTTQLLKERRLSLREQVKDALTASSTPSFHFSTTVTTPRLSIPGADVKVGVSVTVLAPPMGKIYNFPVPDLTIKRLDWRLRSYQGLRVLRAPTYAPDKSNTSKSHTFKAWELQTKKGPPCGGGGAVAVFRPKQGGFENQTCIVTIGLPASMAPSFKTFNLWRGYRLECCVTFEVAGKEAEAFTETDLNLVSRPVGGGEFVEGGGVMEEEGKAVSLEMAEEVVRRCLV